MGSRICAYFQNSAAIYVIFRLIFVWKVQRVLRRHMREAGSKYDDVGLLRNLGTLALALALLARLLLDATKEKISYKYAFSLQNGKQVIIA
jgi:hypothetical protein